MEQVQGSWERVHSLINTDSWRGPVQPLRFAPPNQKFCRVLHKTGADGQKIDVSGASDVVKIWNYIKGLFK